MRNFQTYSAYASLFTGVSPLTVATTVPVAELKTSHRIHSGHHCKAPLWVASAFARALAHAFARALARHGSSASSSRLCLVPQSRSRHYSQEHILWQALATSRLC